LDRDVKKRKDPERQAPGRILHYSIRSPRITGLPFALTLFRAFAGLAGQSIPRAICSRRFLGFLFWDTQQDKPLMFFDSLLAIGFFLSPAHFHNLEHLIHRNCDIGVFANVVPRSPPHTNQSYCFLATLLPRLPFLFTVLFKQMDVSHDVLRTPASLPCHLILRASHPEMGQCQYSPRQPVHPCTYCQPPTTNHHAHHFQRTRHRHPPFNPSSMTPI
jgi:hypothetical protein